MPRVSSGPRQSAPRRFGAHDLRRTCAKPCRKAGGDLEQVKFLLGHSSIQTTERYLGSEQEIAVSVVMTGWDFEQQSAVLYLPRREEFSGKSSSDSVLYGHTVTHSD